MLDGLVPSDAMRCLLANPHQPGKLSVMATGPGVVYIGDNGTGRTLEDPYAVCPDPVGYLADAVADGFFNSVDGTNPTLRLLNTATTMNATRQTWNLEALSIAPGLIRILGNMLVARGLETLSIQDPSDTQCDLSTIPYPRPAAKLRMEVAYHPPEIASHDRNIEINFRDAPDEAELSLTFEILDRWNKLCGLGAYPRDHEDPRNSGLIPDLADLSEKTTVRQSITDYFGCHEATFVSLVTGFDSGPGRHLDITGIEIR